MGRFPANCFVFSLFPSFFLFSFSFSLFLFFFFFRPRSLSSCIGSVLLIVTALSSFVDFENENATSRSNLAIGRCLSLLILSPAGNWRKAIFTGGEREREVTCLETTRWNAIRERRNCRRRNSSSPAMKISIGFLRGFFRRDFRRRPYPSCATTRGIRLSTFSKGTIFCFDSVVSRTGAFTFPLSRDEIQRHCRILGDLGT